MHGTRMLSTQDVRCALNFKPHNFHYWLAMLKGN
jgi:hypothetical protein